MSNVRSGVEVKLNLDLLSLVSADEEVTEGIPISYDDKSS